MENEQRLQLLKLAESLDSKDAALELQKLNSVKSIVPLSPLFPILEEEEIEEITSVTSPKGNEIAGDNEQSKKFPLMWHNNYNDNAGKSTITEVDGKYVVKTDCSKAILCQIRTENFDVKEGEEYELSYDLTIEGTQGLDFAVFNTKKKSWVKEFAHLDVGDKKGNESFVIPNTATNISLVFFTKKRGPSFNFTINDLILQKK